MHGSFNSTHSATAEGQHSTLC